MVKKQAILIPDNFAGILGPRWGEISDPILPLLTFGSMPRFGLFEEEIGDEKTASDWWPNLKKIIGNGHIWLLLLLSACTTDSAPDEDFEAPTLNFPLLGNVPDRPLIPKDKDIQYQKKQLQIERDQALKNARNIGPTQQ